MQSLTFSHENVLSYVIKKGTTPFLVCNQKVCCLGHSNLLDKEVVSMMCQIFTQLEFAFLKMQGLCI